MGSPHTHGFKVFNRDKEELMSSRRYKHINLQYSDYRVLFMEIIKSLQFNSDHRPHDPRKTFITLAKNFGVDKYTIKYMVGHEITDVTEKVYTERNKEWL